MNDTIVQEVREIRASIAAEFGYNRTSFLARAREQTRLRKHTEDASSPNKALPPTDGAAVSSYAADTSSAPHRCQS